MYFCCSIDVVFLINLTRHFLIIFFLIVQKKSLHKIKSLEPWKHSGMNSWGMNWVVSGQHSFQYTSPHINASHYKLVHTYTFTGTRRVTTYTYSIKHDNRKAPSHPHRLYLSLSLAFSHTVSHIHTSHHTPFTQIKALNSGNAAAPSHSPVYMWLVMYTHTHTSLCKLNQTAFHQHTN